MDKGFVHQRTKHTTAVASENRNEFLASAIENLLYYGSWGKKLRDKLKHPLVCGLNYSF